MYVLYGMTTHVFAECLGDRGLWLSYVVSVLCLSVERGGTRLGKHQLLSICAEC